MYDRFTRWVFQHRLAFLLLVSLVCVSADQASKIWAQSELAEPRTRIVRVNEGGELKDVEKTLFVHTRTIELVDGGFNLIYRENPAAAFSLTRQMPDWLRRPFLLIFSSLAMILIGAWYFRLKREDGLLMGSFALIVAGAIGNLIDRARFGYVVDFLDVYVSWGPAAQWLNSTVGTNHWPTFNVADSCIVVGALAVVYRTLKPLPEPPSEEQGKGEGDKAAAASEQAA